MKEKKEIIQQNNANYIVSMRMIVVVVKKAV
jgi:hypothetical protein